MLNNFVIFSLEKGPTANPQNMNPHPTKMVVFDKDPIVTGTYDAFAGSTMRGVVIPTLGGTVVQDFGSQIMDQRITITDEAALKKATVDAIIALEAITGGEYYFTDGYDCYRVLFVRPIGFVYRRNLVTSFFGVARFDYELYFVVKVKENV